MKILFAVLILLSSCFTIYSQSKVVIGMSTNEFNKIYPSLNNIRYENESTYTRADNIYGIENEWGYRFENDKLNWIYFMNYIDSLDENNFHKCLTAAQNVIKDYTQQYGKPDTVIIGDTTFVDPYVKIHWGYDVIEARWENYNNMKIKVEFTFMGGKGGYHFLFKINYFDKSYPYFD